MKTFLIIIVLALGGGAAWNFAPSGLSTAEAAARFADSSFEVIEGNLRITIAENGYLKSKNSEHLEPKFRGRGTITWLIDEGSEVEEGTVLVKFDGSETQQRLEEMQASLLQHETSLEASEADLDIASSENEAAIEHSQLSLEISKLTLERYEKGEHPNTVRKNNLAQEKAESEFKRATERFSKVPQLEEEGFLTSIQVEEERIRLREAEINAENARKDVELYTTYTRPMELKQKLADVRDKERTLKTARKKAEINLKEKQARVARNEAQVIRTNRQIDEVNEDIEAMEIKAPRPGLVLYGDPRRPWRRDEIEVGKDVYRGWTLITLPDLTEMQVLIDVHEADVDKVSLEQKCIITLDTYPGQIFTGKITEIASVAQSSNWGDDTNKQFSVEVTMDELEIVLRAGITAKVEIEIETLEDVVQVPIHAVFKEAEKYFCFRPTRTGGFERRTVTVGANNDHYVEIESGLELGDTVLLVDPRKDGLVEDQTEGEDGDGSETVADTEADEATEADDETDTEAEDAGEAEDEADATGETEDAGEPEATDDALAEPTEDGGA